MSTGECSVVNPSATMASDNASRARDAVLFSAQCAMSRSLARVIIHWARHFKLHVSVMRYSLEACKCISPQEGVISAVERGHLEGYLFGPIILRRAEYHVKFDFSRTPCLPTGNDSSEGRVALLDAAPVYFHFVECILIDEV